MGAHNERGIGRYRRLEGDHELMPLGVGCVADLISLAGDAEYLKSARIELETMKGCIEGMGVEAGTNLGMVVVDVEDEVHVADFDGRLGEVRAMIFIKRVHTTTVNVRRTII